MTVVATAAGLASAAPTVELEGEPPIGRWTTFANADDVLSLVADGDTLWAGTRAGGLLRWDLDPATGEPRGSRQFLKPQDPLGGNTVRDLEVDGAGRLWLATDGGLTLYDDRGTPEESDDRWHTWTQASSFGGLPTGELHALALQGDLVWVGGRQVRDPLSADWSGGGVGRLDTRGTEETGDDVWAPLVTFDSSKQEPPGGELVLGLVSDNINDLSFSTGGILWVATDPHWTLQDSADPEAPNSWQRVHGGLSRVDTRDTVDSGDDLWTGSSCETTQLSVTCSVQAIRSDPSGRIWAAIGGRGLISFSPALLRLPDALERFAPPYPGDGHVLDIAFGPAANAQLANTVWAATRDGGIQVLDHKGSLINRADDRWNEALGRPFDRAAGMARDRIQALAVTGGEVFAGTGPERGVAGGIDRIALSDLSLGTPLRHEGAPRSNFITDIALGDVGGPWADHAWIATGSRSPSVSMRYSGAGLSVLDTQGNVDPADDTWAHHDTLSTDDDGRLPWSGLTGDNVQSLAIDGERVWAGSMSAVWDREASRYVDGGLALFSDGRWTARTEAGISPPADPLRIHAVSAIAKGCAGELWLGTGEPWDHAGSGAFILQTGTDAHDRSQDQWLRHQHPSLASNNVTSIRADCGSDEVWVAGTHHVKRDGGAGSPWVGGGLAVMRRGDGRWTRYTTEDGLESFAEGEIRAEITSLDIDPTGVVRAGGYGTREMTSRNLVVDKPNWPASLNTRAGEAWTPAIFERSGWVTSSALDLDGRLWVSASRGGLAKDSASPEVWQADASAGGLFVRENGAWAKLDAASSGIPSDEVSVIRVAPDGTIWIGTEGWGLARFEPGAPPPTPTATSDAVKPSPSATPKATVERTPTPFGQGGSATRTATRRSPGESGTIHLPFLAQSRR